MKSKNKAILDIVLNLILGLILVINLSGCSGYKSTWDCPKVKGIGCSSLDYADEIARKQILLNSDDKQRKKMLKKNIFIRQNDAVRQNDINTNNLALEKNNLEFEKNNLELEEDNNDFKDGEIY